tara:strand:+ start:655 stop:867 length:213 start_codon:yes stop_codon:yes gene_type:complete
MNKLLMECFVIIITLHHFIISNIDPRTMDRRLATSSSSGERMAWVKFGIEVALAVAAVYMMKTYIAGKLL